MLSPCEVLKRSPSLCPPPHLSITSVPEGLYLRKGFLIPPRLSVDNLKNPHMPFSWNWSMSTFSFSSSLPSLSTRRSPGGVGSSAQVSQCFLSTLSPGRCGCLYSDTFYNSHQKPVKYAPCASLLCHFPATPGNPV